VLVAHREALLGREPVDLALDGEQGIDALDRLDGDRRFLQPRQIEIPILICRGSNPAAPAGESGLCASIRPRADGRQEPPAL
jgi:hypothetical protein